MSDAFTAFFVVFGVIGGIELIDRTSFALIAYASKHPPFPSWAGAAGAFVLTTGVSVGVGTALEAAFHQELVWIRVGGGVVLLGYAAYLALVPEHDRQPPTGRSTLVAAFLLILLLELGDTTMIITIVFVVTFSSVLAVFLGAALALSAVAGFSAFVGSRLGAKVEPRVLERVVVGILVVAGIVTIAAALAPGWFAWI